MSLSAISVALLRSRYLLEGLKIVHDIRHGCANAFTTTNGCKVGQLIAPHNRKSERAIPPPRLLDLYVVRNVLNELVDRWFVGHACREARLVQKINDGPSTQNREVF